MPTTKLKPWATPERLENIARLSSYVLLESTVAFYNKAYRKKAEKLIWRAWDELEEVMTKD